ncbi:MAG: ATP-binding protein [Defluviicoccus sp.]
MRVLGSLRRLRAAYENLSLQTVIAGALVAGLVIPLALSTLLDWQFRRATLRANLADDHRKLVDVLAQGLTTPVWNLDPDAGRPLLAAVLSDPRVVSVHVATPFDADFLHARTETAPVGEVLALAAPIRRGMQEIGEVRLEMATAQLDQELASDTSRAAVVLGLQLIASIAIIMILLHHKVVQPLRQLLAQSKRIAAGELGHASVWSRLDEVGRLGASMEEMRRSLHGLFAALQERNWQLQQSEQRFETAARSLRDGLAIFDAADRLVYYNEAYPQHLAASLRAVIALGKPFEIWVREGLAIGPIYHPDMGADFPARRFALRQKEFADHEHQLIDGRWVRIRESRMPDGGRVLLAADVTDRHARDRALMESEERFRAIAEGAPVAVTIAQDDPPRMVYANSLARELFGTVATDDSAAIPRLWSDLGARTRLIERVEQGERVDGYETELRRVDGTPFPALISARKLIYGGVPAFLFAISDLMLLKSAEAEIARQREALHQNEKLAALGSLLAGVAHELNNPLTVVIGYAALLRDLAADPGTRARAERVCAAADRCARIVKTFLALARQKPQNKAAVDVNAILAGTIEMLGYQLQTSDIEVIRDLGPDLPRLWADGDQLAQVFINLIVNAQAALRSVPVPRRLWIATSAAADTVRIEVADNGPGVPEAIRARIFDPFFTTKEVGAGTGLGLSVSRGIIAAHGGSLSYEPRPGGGAQFRVELPQAVERVEHPHETPAATHRRPARVLIVDDEADIRAFVAETLAVDGHDVAEAASGRAAIDRLGTQPFDLILSDLRMPDTDGEALYRHLRKMRPDLAGRLVFLTGDVLSASAAALINESGLPVLEKPLDPAALRQRVNALLAAVEGT